MLHTQLRTQCFFAIVLSLTLFPRASAETLLDCPIVGEEGGDLIHRGFYIPNYPGHSLGTVTLHLRAEPAGEYTFSLTAREGTYDGNLVGTASQSVQLAVDTFEPVTFSFGNTPVTENSTVTFELGQVSGPNASVYYSVPSQGDTACPVIQTSGTTPPLDSERRQGVRIAVTGHARDLFVQAGDSIQDAIDAANPGDTVRVAEGTFQESFSMRSEISVVGAGMDKTTVEGTGSAVVTAIDVNDATLQGFHFTSSGSGQPTSDGVEIRGGDLVVGRNKVTGNQSGISISSGSTAIIKNNFVCDNGNDENEILDYGIIVLHSTPLITNNRVCRNEVGIYVAWADSTGTRIINNTVVHNESSGIWCYNEADAIIKNNISAQNSTGISTLSDAKPVMNYNNVWNNSFRDYDPQGGGVAAPGVGSISEDPLFHPSAPDRFLLSEGSPCIDAGDPRPIYNDPDGTRNDMGYTGGPGGLEDVIHTPIASGFVFTSVGNIPVSQITQSGPSLGLANVSSSAAADLSIPAYKDAPFGAKVWLNGLFGDFDDNVEYYQLLMAPWTGGTPPSSSDFVPLDDPLSKVRYTVDSSGRVTAGRVSVGPDSDGLYQRTDSGYWAHPDLKLIWDTRRVENGTYELAVKAFDSTRTEVSLPSNENDSITLVVDNEQVQVEIEQVLHDGSPVPECGIVNLSSPDENIAFDITAWHPNGYLHSFSLGTEYGSNKSAGPIVSQRYKGENDGSRPTWHGVSSTRFHSSDSTALDPWQTCAYQFNLHARARTTSGFHRIYRSRFHENLTLEVTPSGGGLVADLDGDGDVDGDDLAILAADFGNVGSNGD